MMKIFYSIAVLSMALAASSCSSEDAPKQAAAPAVNPNKLTEPFRFHKAIEVKPGLTFDVLSWGRGAEYVGAYMILRSDSSRAEYKSIHGELEGEITDVWNMDMDSDGNPELFIQAKGQDKDSYLKMYIYEFTESGSQQQLRFPDITPSTKRSYRGKDSVFVKDGELFREFPLFEEADTAGVNPTGKKLLQYSLRGNNFNVKEIKEEDKKEEKKDDKKK
ncbi:hypothetical protein [Desertivirga brevis]|uniref:hypothetical protein n=1 Tax=Desertivirga brevis TaxID=2810310 RepID=UPI001A95A3FA|nr:hypothetical protein [Pedobacter sp. SYSU D00873]